MSRHPWFWVGLLLVGGLGCERKQAGSERASDERSDVPEAARNALGTQAASTASAEESAEWRAPELPGQGKPGFEPAPPVSGAPEPEGIPL